MTKDSHNALDKDSPKGLSKGRSIYVAKETKTRTDLCVVCGSGGA